MRWNVATWTACLALGLAAARVAAQAPPPVANDYRFDASMGLLVFHVHPERTREFETVAERLNRGLETTGNPARREQAAGWRLFRATDTAAGAVYVVVIDPVVRGADYDPVRMLTEFAPDDVQSLYEQLRSSVIRVERLNLEPLGQAPRAVLSLPSNLRTPD